jgi:hypothetical protein
MSTKPELDKFYYREMLDRLHVVMSIADDHLQQHPVAKIESEIGKHIDDAVSSLWQAYQLTGKIEFEKFEDI